MQSTRFVKQAVLVVLVAVVTAWFGTQIAAQQMQQVQGKTNLLAADDGKPCPLC
jgi:hypothetical protein